MDILELLIKKKNKSSLLESDEREILLEDDSEEDSDDTDDFGSDDSDEDMDDVGNFDLQSKNEIAVIKSTIDKLIGISEYMLVVNNSDFYEVLNALYKIKYLFMIYINNYDQYSDKEHDKIINMFKKSIQYIYQQLNKKL